MRPRPTAPDPADPALLAHGTRRLERVQRTTMAFFEREADALSRACRDLAGRIAGGGRLLVFGSRTCASDVRHISMGVDDPLRIGACALPTLALEGSPAAKIRLLSAPGDVALGVTADGEDPEVIDGLVAARRLGLLTVAFSGGDGGPMADVPLHYSFCVPDGNPTVVQEVHEVLHHVLAELACGLLANEEPKP